MAVFHAGVWLSLDKMMRGISLLLFLIFTVGAGKDNKVNEAEMSEMLADVVMWLQVLELTWWWPRVGLSVSTASLLALQSPGVAGCLPRAAATGRAVCAH